MKKIATLFTAIALLAGLSFTGTAQESEKLPRSTPEQEGVSSEGIINLFNAVDTNKVELHSFMLIRHGKVIAESWWKPFGPDYKHIMYSASKTFTATSVGLAVSEGKLKITDKVISFFPYSLPDTISDYMKELTVKDLLTMSVGQDPEPSAQGSSLDWMTKFMKTPPVHQPGTVFKYNNMATFMLSAIVQQVTGERVYDYLMPRIFKPLGIRGIDWDLTPQGINVGMIGLRLKTEDMAKFGQLLLNGGVWNKKQLIPKEWVAAATSMQIPNYDPNTKKPKELDDWAQGYCYQMWRGRYNTVRLDGMAGQFVVLIPDKDAIVVFTANASNTQKELNLIYDYLIPAIKSDKPLAANQALQDEIQKRKEKLRLNTGFTPSVKSDFESKIAGKEFVITANDYNIQSAYFTFANNECLFAFKRNNSIVKVKAGVDDWKVTNSGASSLLAPPRGSYSKSIDAAYTVPQPIFKMAARCSWTDKSTLEITGRFVEENIGAETIVCRFTEQNGAVRLTIEPKSAGGQGRGPMGMSQPVVLRGSLVKIE